MEIFKNQSLKQCFYSAATDCVKNIKRYMRSMWPAMLLFAVLLSVTEYFFLPNKALHDWGIEQQMTSFVVQTVVYVLTIAALFLPIKPFINLTGQKPAAKKALHGMKLLIKHPGDTLIAFILLVFIAVAVMIILAMPAGIMTTAFSMAQIGTLEGDPLGLPAYFTAIMLIMMTASNFLLACVIFYATMVMTFLAGSCAVRDREKKAIITENKKLQDNEQVMIADK